MRTPALLFTAAILSLSLIGCEADAKSGEASKDDAPPEARLLLELKPVAVASPDVPKEAEVTQRSVAVLTVAGVS